MRKPSKQVAPAPVDAFAIARELLLEGQGLELAALERALSVAMVRKLDYVDLYLQLTRYETWTVEDGIVKEGAYSVDQGIGVRAVSGERTGFAYSDQLDEVALTDAVVAARGIARSKSSGGAQKIPARVASHRPLYPSGDPLRSMTDSDKVAAALKGLTIDSPIGKQTLRAKDQQANRGQFWGKMVKDDKVPFAVMQNVTYIDPAPFMD